MYNLEAPPRIGLIPCINCNIMRYLPTIAFLFCVLTVAAQEPPYLNPKLPLQERVADLLRRMTLEEKVSQMMNKSAAIDRLHIPAYNWWNEGLHGVARTGKHATVFPQAIGNAATFDKEGLLEMAKMISTEAALRLGGRTAFTWSRSPAGRSISWVAPVWSS